MLRASWAFWASLRLLSAQGKASLPTFPQANEQTGQKSPNKRLACKAKDGFWCQHLSTFYSFLWFDAVFYAFSARFFFLLLNESPTVTSLDFSRRPVENSVENVENPLIARFAASFWCCRGCGKLFFSIASVLPPCRPFAPPICIVWALQKYHRIFLLNPWQTI